MHYVVCGHCGSEYMHYVVCEYNVFNYMNYVVTFEIVNLNLKFFWLENGL